MRKTILLVLRTSSLVLLLSCAQMQVPGGGPRDTTPPRAIKYTPDSAKVNFTGNSIRILFDENILLRDIQSNLIISPPLQKQPDVKLIKNRIVELTFNEVLKPNTTYNVFFGSGIADVHEGNVAEGFRYIFSTGPVLDSISLIGSVMDAFTGAQLKDHTVMLYAGTEDSLPFKKIPDYFTRSGTGGSFTIRNIRPGNYKAVAVRDLNKNFLLDRDEESFAFSDSILDLSNHRKINFRSYAELKQKQFVKRSTLAAPGKVMIVLNKPCPDLKINVRKASRPRTYMQLNPLKDTAFFYLAGWEEDSLELFLSSDQDLWKETVILRTASKEKPKLQARIIHSSGTFQDPDAPVILQFNYPIDTFKFSGMMDREELNRSDSNALEFTIEGNTVEIRPSYVSHPSHWEFDTEHDILLHPGCFTGFGELLSDTIRLKFSVKEQRYYGSLDLQVKWKGGKGIIELLNEKGGVVYRETGDGSAKLKRELLPPGKYRARLILDGNGNGKWDGGEYLRHAQPEKVLYSPGTYHVRSDWDVQEVWNVE